MASGSRNGTTGSARARPSRRLSAAPPASQRQPLKLAGGRAASPSAAPRDADFVALEQELPFLLYSVGAERRIAITHVSPGMAPRLGVTSGRRSDVWDLGEIVHAEDRARVLEGHAHAAASGVALSDEYRLIAADGSLVWVHDNGVPDGDDASGRVLHGYCVDITGHEEIEQPPRADEGQFRALVANIPGAVYRCRCDSDWTIRFMSDGIEAIVGYPAGDFIGNRARTYGSVIHPDDRPGVIREIDEAFERGLTYSLEYRLIHADGSARWIAEQGRAITGPDGEKLWLDGVILDIGKRKAAEQARDRAESELKAQSELNRQRALHDSLTGVGESNTLSRPG